MKIRDYKKYFDTTTDDLASDERKHLVTYFSLLRQVEKPIASLVIPVYIAKETLLAHIISLSNIRTIIPYEVLFIDNNADPVTLNILEQLGATVFKESQQGITHARQKGLECAKGDIIFTMDPDTIYDPSYVDKMALPFYEDKDLVLCYSMSKSYKNNFQLDFQNHIKNWIKKPYFRWKSTQRFVIRMSNVRACAMAIRKNAILTIGYPTDLKSVAGCDDGLIAVKLNHAGKFKYIPTNIFTALPPLREKSEPFPFCNEKFYTFLIMMLLLSKIYFAQSISTCINTGLLTNDIYSNLYPLDNLTEEDMANLEQLKFCNTSSENRDEAEKLKKKIRLKKITLKTNYDLGVYKKFHAEQLPRRFADQQKLLTKEHHNYMVSIFIELSKGNNHNKKIRNV